MCQMLSDFEKPAVYAESKRKARKPHRCGECGRTISESERYVVSSGLWDGEWMTFKHCAHCEVLCQWLIVQCGSLIHGGVLADCEEHVRDYSIKSLFGLARCVLAAKKHWKLRGDKLRKPPILPKTLDEIEIL